MADYSKLTRDEKKAMCWPVGTKIKRLREHESSLLPPTFVAELSTEKPAGEVEFNIKANVKGSEDCGRESHFFELIELPGETPSEMFQIY